MMIMGVGTLLISIGLKVSEIDCVSEPIADRRRFYSPNFVRINRYSTVYPQGF
jgi:hypothetical protein